MQHNPIPPDAKHAQRLADFLRNLPYRQYLYVKAALADAKGDNETLQRCNSLLDEYEAKLVVEYPNGSFWGIDRQENEPNNWTYYSPYGVPLLNMWAENRCWDWDFHITFSGKSKYIGYSSNLSPEEVQIMTRRAIEDYHKQTNQKP